MAAEVDICNLALSHLGDKATVASIDPPEGSTQASHCARFYPVARDFVLESSDWGFATTRVSLSDLTETNPPPASWAYTYALPNDCVRILGVYAADATNDDELQEYIRETTPDGTVNLIYCPIENAVLRYTRRVIDTTRFSPLFVDGLSRVLASYLAGPILKGDEGRDEGERQMKAGLAIIDKAQLSDARQIRSNTYRDESRNRPSWIAGRAVNTRRLPYA